MPLDGHAHLVSQGWSGKGNGLRSGAIAKPVIITQKKTLAGVGKDRDEAFPFWDHVFQAASVSIQVKIHNSDDESDSEGSSVPALPLQRTKTGIISNRRPTTGVSTPSELPSSGASTPRLSVMAQAKQQAARRMLYAMFYRGAVLSTEDAEAEPVVPMNLPQSLEKESKKETKSKKRKYTDMEGEAEAERKLRRCEAKDKEKKEKHLNGKEKNGKRSKKVKGSEGEEGVCEDSAKARAARKAERAERRRLRAEKLARKLERRKRKAAQRSDEDAQPDDPNSMPRSQEPSDGVNSVDRIREQIDDISTKHKRSKKKAKKS